MKTDKLSSDIHQQLLKSLQSRFEKNKHRHAGISWDSIIEKLKNNDRALRSLYEMENTGGEPDVVSLDKNSGKISFYDFAPESPKGRRSVCYDREGLEARKEHQPANNAIDMAISMGIKMLDEVQYRKLQQIEQFDLKTSSWILTPPKIRKLGGALFADRRYDHVFVYHNGAQSYYAARGFRGYLTI